MPEHPDTLILVAGAKPALVVFLLLKSRRDKKRRVSLMKIKCYVKDVMA